MPHSLKTLALSFSLGAATLGFTGVAIACDGAGCDRTANLPPFMLVRVRPRSSSARRLSCLRAPISRDCPTPARPVATAMPPQRSPRPRRRLLLPSRSARPTDVFCLARAERVLDYAPVTVLSRAGVLL